MVKGQVPVSITGSKWAKQSVTILLLKSNRIGSLPNFIPKIPPDKICVNEVNASAAILSGRQNLSWGNNYLMGTSYQRVLLKLSGEALMGDLAYGIEPRVVQNVAQEVSEVVADGTQMAIVVGGGNIFRGVKAAAGGMDRATADYIGMIATVMNAMTLQDALEQIGVPTRVQTAISMQEIAEPYIRRRAIRHLEKQRVVIFGAGSGNPFFTTDTTAALRAAEINAEVIFKATKVDGVYDSDPHYNPQAKRYQSLTYKHVLAEELRVMDSTAIALCKENDIPILVFNLSVPGNIRRAVMGESVGTLVGGFCEIS